MKKLHFLLIAFLSIQLNAQITYTPTQTYDAVQASYKILKWHYPWGMSTYVTSNVLSDDAKSGGSNTTERPEYENADKFTLSATNKGPEMLWEKLMTGINKANAILTFGSQEQTDSVKRLWAEAKFLRAYFYFDLLRFFGNVPLITEVDGALRYPQASTLEVYTQIEKDLNEAIPVLPLKSALSNSDIDRATKGAAQTLLGKVYLYQQKWEDASNILQEVINSGQYSLLANFKDLWQSGQEHTIESIFEIPYTDAYPMNWNGHPDGNVDIQLMGIKGLKGFPGLTDGWGFCLPTQDLVDAFTSESDTTRLNATVIKASDLTKAGATFTPSYDQTGYYNNKYATRFDPKNYYMFTQNEIVFRYAEVLLMCAEAKYNLGEESIANNYLNQVRSRAKLSAKSLTGIELLNAIQKERRLELALESNRYFDLIRWNKPEEVLSTLGYKSETKGLYPIPAAAMYSNNLLVQNTGYAAPPKKTNDIYPGSEIFRLYKTGLLTILNYKYSWDLTDSLLVSYKKFVWNNDKSALKIYIGPEGDTTGIEIDTFLNGKIKSSKTLHFDNYFMKWDTTFMYEYDNNGYVIIQNMPLYGNLIEYKRDSKGNEIFYKSKYDSSKYEYVYKNEKIETQTRYSYINNSWRVVNIYHYYYNTTGELTTIDYENYNYDNLNNTMVLSSTTGNKYEYTTINNNLIKYLVKYNNGNGIYNLNGITDYAYTDRNDLSSESFYGFESLLNTFHITNRNFYYYGYNGTEVNSNQLDKNSIRFFPNPIVNESVLKVYLSEKADVNIQILSLDGKTLRDIKLKNLINGENQVRIDLTNVKSGVYLAKVQIGNSIPSMIKLIKK